VSYLERHQKKDTLNSFVRKDRGEEGKEKRKRTVQKGEKGEIHMHGFIYTLGHQARLARGGLP